MMNAFTEMGLSNPLLQAIIDMGYEEPTPIQQQTIPVALQGRNIIGQAQTGTGKTAAFGIPLIELCNSQETQIQGLVIAPTRELAVQVAEELYKIGQYKDIHTLPIYGGQDITRQLKALKNRPHIIVGTPGRLMDHIRRKSIVLKYIRFVVLDEADEMLNMGFINDIESILAEIPEERQTMLFSATIPKPIKLLAQKFMQEPVVTTVQNREVTVPSIEQHYMEVKDQQKFEILCRLLDIHTPESAIIFGRTRRRVAEIAEGLNKRGYPAAGIHGDLSQAQRDSVLRQFKDGTIELLVASDVAARGLDIDGITHIYNFDIPQDPEWYIHRIGRTGRMGKTGIALTFVTPREMNHLRTIEETIKRKLIRRSVPSFSEAIEGQQRQTVERLFRAVESSDIISYRELAEELLEENDSVTLLAGALKLLIRETDATPVKLTEDLPRFKGAGIDRRKNDVSKSRRPHQRGKSSHERYSNNYASR